MLPAEGLQIAQAHIQVRFQQFCHQAIFQTSQQAGRQLAQQPCRAGQGQHALPVRGAAVQQQKQMMLPFRFFQNVLHVIKQQRVAVLPEKFRVLCPGGGVAAEAGRRSHAHAPAPALELLRQRLKQMGLARAAAAIEHQRTVGPAGGRCGNALHRRQGKGILGIAEERFQFRAIAWSVVRAVVRSGGMGRRRAGARRLLLRRKRGVAQRRRRHLGPGGRAHLIADGRQLRQAGRKGRFKGRFVRCKKAGIEGVRKGYQQAGIFLAQVKAVQPGARHAWFRFFQHSVHILPQ